MIWDDWTAIVAKLNASYPDQPINAATAAEWYSELDHLDPGDAWLAIRRLRRECRWRPSLAELLAGVKVYRAELAEQARSQDRRRALGRQGTPMPPEARQAMEILADSVSGRIDKTEAGAMIDTLGNRLAERIGPGWEVADA